MSTPLVVTSCSSFQAGTVVTGRLLAPHTLMLRVASAFYHTCGNVTTAAGCARAPTCPVNLVWLPLDGARMGQQITFRYLSRELAALVSSILLRGPHWAVSGVASLLGGAQGGDISGLKGGCPCELLNVVCMTSLKLHLGPVITRGRGMKTHSKHGMMRGRCDMHAEAYRSPGVAGKDCGPWTGAYIFGREGWHWRSTRDLQEANWELSLRALSSNTGMDDPRVWSSLYSIHTRYLGGGQDSYKQLNQPWEPRAGTWISLPGPPDASHPKTSPGNIDRVPISGDGECDCWGAAASF